MYWSSFRFFFFRSSCPSEVVRATELYIEQATVSFAPGDSLVLPAVRSEVLTTLEFERIKSPFVERLTDPTVEAPKKVLRCWRWVYPSSTQIHVRHIFATTQAPTLAPNSKPNQGITETPRARKGVCKGCPRRRVRWQILNGSCGGRSGQKCALRAQGSILDFQPHCRSESQC